MITALQETLTGTEIQSLLVAELVTTKCRYQRRLLFKVRERRLRGEEEEEKEMEKGAGRGAEGEEEVRRGRKGDEEEGEGS